MTDMELEQIIRNLKNNRMFDEIFVIILEKDNMEYRLIDYGMREISDLAAWIAVEKQKTEGEKM